MSKAAEAVSEKISDSVCETVTDMLREAGFKDAKLEANDKDLFASLIDAAVAPLIEAANEARRVLRLDRESLFECHRDPKTGDVEDEPGKEGLREYDAALDQLNKALEQWRTGR